MKLGVLAASALIGVASFAPAAFAQGAGNATLEVGRTQEIGSMATSNRIAMPGPAPTLEGNRPASGFMPQPTGPIGSYHGEASNVSQGADLRPALRRQ